MNAQTADSLTGITSYSNCPTCGQPVVGGQFACGHSPNGLAPNPIGLAGGHKASDTPRAFDTARAVEVLTARYQAMLEVVNASGDLNTYIAALPLFQEIADEGRKYNVGFDANPTVCWNNKKKPETGWLVEADVNGKTAWVQSANGNQLTTDSTEAIRFSRKEDAERYINTLIAALRPLLIATEHSWS